MNRRKIKLVLAFFVLWLHLLFACCFIRDDNFSFYHYFTCCFVDRPWMSKSKVKELRLMIFCGLMENWEIILRMLAFYGERGGYKRSNLRFKCDWVILGHYKQLFDCNFYICHSYSFEKPTITLPPCTSIHIPSQNWIKPSNSIRLTERRYISLEMKLN